MLLELTTYVVLMLAMVLLTSALTASVVAMMSLEAFCTSKPLLDDSFLGQLLDPHSILAGSNIHPNHHSSLQRPNLPDIGHSKLASLHEPVPKRIAVSSSVLEWPL